MDDNKTAADWNEQQARRAALDIANSPNTHAKQVIERAQSFLAFLKGETPELGTGPITRKEIERRGFDQEEGAQETMLGIMAKLGFPNYQNPLGSEPTHILVPMPSNDVILAADGLQREHDMLEANYTNTARLLEAGERTGYEDPEAQQDSRKRQIDSIKAALTVLAATR